MTLAKRRRVVAAVIAYCRKPGADIEVVARTLEKLLPEMRNRTPSGPRARSTSVPVTAAVEAQIKQLKISDPGLPQHEIGNRVGTNQGRVNETLIGKRP